MVGLQGRFGGGRRGRLEDGGVCLAATEEELAAACAVHGTRTRRRRRLGWGVGRFGPARLSWAGSPRRRKKIENKRKGIGPKERKNGVLAR
jgi:hypothetical protein